MVSRLDRLRQKARVARSLRRMPTVERLKRSARAGLREYAAAPADVDLVSSRAAFNEIMNAGDAHFARGEFAEAAESARRAAKEASDAAEVSGLSSWDVRICGDSLLNYIGHMAEGLGSRARFRSLGLDDSNYLLLASSRTANSRLLSYWAEHFPVAWVSPRQQVEIERMLWPITEHVAWCRVGDEVKTLYEACAESRIAWVAASKPPLFTLQDRDSTVGRNVLRSLGMADDDWFVTLHAREDARGPAYGRNTRINDYLPAIDVITERGGWVVRLGKPGMAPLPSRSRVIDLAQIPNTPQELDVYLLGACRFMIATQSGPGSVPPLFGVPELWTNSTGIGFLPCVPGSLSIPKLIIDGGQVLSLTEMHARGLTMSDGVLARMPDSRLAWLDNTSEQIADGVREMLAGAYESAPSEADLAADSLRDRSIRYPGPRFSPEFLRTHL